MICRTVLMRTFFLNTVLCKCSFLLGLMIQVAIATNLEAKNIDNETYLTRYLHPKPQILNFKSDVCEFKFHECFLSFTGSNDLQKEIIADFSLRWANRYGTHLREGSSQPGALNIRVGLFKEMAGILRACNCGIIATKYLPDSPNSEQAYSIAMEKSGLDGLNVYIVANDIPGLYYGLLTLEQLTEPLSKGDTLVLPVVDIVDWPDVRLRGTWTLLRHVGSDSAALYTYDALIKRFSRYKLNFTEAWHINVSESKGDGPIDTAWVFPKSVIDIGKRYAVEVVPGTGHLPHKFFRSGSESLKKRFPGAPGIKKKKERKILHLCQRHPDTRGFYTQYLTSIAKQFSLVDVWMSEIEGPRGVCHCPQCKGDTRSAFVNETRNLMYAYREAKKVNPNFRMILGLTQGSYPHHFSMLEHIPREVNLNFYNGKMTYKTWFQFYNLPPSVMEMQRLGYTVGSTPSPIDTQMMVPFMTPQYMRLLCGEAEDRHLDFVMAQMWPDPFANDFNAQAMAEFLWNSSGRTAEEFTLAWVTRKGWAHPKEAAAVIQLLEYPARGIHNAQVRHIVNEVVGYIEKEDWHKRVVRSIRGDDLAEWSVLGKFEYPTHHEMARVRALCEEGVRRAEEIDNQELVAASRLLGLWASILERYAWCLETSDAEEKRKAVKDIKSAFKDIPAAHAAWISHKDLSDYAKKYTSRWFEQQRVRWQSVVGGD